MNVIMAYTWTEYILQERVFCATFNATIGTPKAILLHIEVESVYPIILHKEEKSQTLSQWYIMISWNTHLFTILW